MENVRYQREGSVAILTFDHPPHNTLTTEMFEQLGRYVAEIDADPDLRVVVIQGAGDRLFTVGADIGEMDVRASLDDRSAQASRWLQGIHDVLRAIEESPKTYICAMKGISYGGGLEMAAACDIRVAARDSRFAMPEVKLGIIPGYGGTQRLARLVGMGHALALVLGAREIDVETAQLWGLVDGVTDTGKAEDSALEMARGIAGHAPLALAAAKQVIRHGVDMDLSDGLSQERSSFVRLSVSADFDEGRQAFIEKRAPHFRGA
jgi:enoyl-CoA hydratase/carnithine racemase